MPSYPELGRHTPPPPPYSLSRCNSSSNTPASEVFQRSDAPSAPPSFDKGPEIKHTIPPIHGSVQTEKLGGLTTPYYGYTNQLPVVPLKDYPTPALNQGKAYADYPLDEYARSIRYGKPVEPKLIHGSRGNTLRLFDKVPLESGSQSVPHQTFTYNQGGELGPNCDTLAPQSQRTVSLRHNVTPYATQFPSHTLLTVDPHSQHMLRRHSSTNTPNTVPPDTPLLPSSLSSGYTLANIPSKDRHSVPSARLAVPFTDRASQDHEIWPQGSHFSNRRPSATIRFDPYRRRQSRAGGKPPTTRYKSGTDEERGGEPQMDSDDDMVEGGEEEI